MITLAHGAGGNLSRQLVERHILPRLDNPALAVLGDSAVLDPALGKVGENETLALTTDGYVVSPRFFAGGDIGRLAVAGTVNDLAMVGARPLALTCGLVLEEGLAISELERVVDSIAATAREAGISVVAGDTKVVPHGACDGLFVTTAGVGLVDRRFTPAAQKIQSGDTLIVSGTIGDHGMTILAAREQLGIAGALKSDAAPLWSLVASLRELAFARRDVDVHALRDPTRGGLAASVVENAEQAGVRVVLDEESIPVRPAVRAACELTGIDPLFVANEGKLIAFVPAACSEQLLTVLRDHPLGRRAAIIGHVEDGAAGVELRTALGGRRVIRLPAGEILPRIC